MKRLLLGILLGATVIGVGGVAVWKQRVIPAWVVQAEDVPDSIAQCWPYRRQMELAGRGLGVEESLKGLEAAFGDECADQPDVISQRQIEAECLIFRRDLQRAQTDADRAIWTALIRNCPT